MNNIILRSHAVHLRAGSDLGSCESCANHISSCALMHDTLTPIPTKLKKYPAECPLCDTKDSILEKKRFNKAVLRIAVPIFMLVSILLVFSIIAQSEEKGISSIGNKPSSSTNYIQSIDVVNNIPVVVTSTNKETSTPISELDQLVYIETYVQAHQSWWDGKITVYAQSKDGAYFLYNMACSEEDAAKLVPGTKILVNGITSAWYGEIEIVDATFEIDLSDTFIAQPTDVTALLGTDELLAHQNEKIIMKGLTVVPSIKDGKEAAFLYNWDGTGSKGNNNDLYFNVTDGKNVYTLTVESYLCDESTDVYAAVTQLDIGDTIDVEAFLYWYNGPLPHVTGVSASFD